MLNPKEQAEYIVIFFLGIGFFKGIDIENFYEYHFDKIFLIFLAVNLLYLFINRKKLSEDLIKKNAIYSLKVSIGTIVMVKVVVYLVKTVVDPLLVHFFG